MELRFRYLLQKIKIVFLLWVTFSNPIMIGAENNSLTIGFGSCASQFDEQPIWNAISTHQPDLFIMMGDNVYSDSGVMVDINNAYQRFSSNPNFSKFRKNTPIIGTWDDHDYGLIDGGKHFDGKENAKKGLIEFFDYPELNQLADKDRGIYHTRWLDFNDKKIQIIMLDTRWYRDKIVGSYLTKTQRKTLNLGPIQPNIDPNTTVLGKEQWQWLESELAKPADLKLLVSSIQVLAEYTGWEAWGNFPHEREKLLDTLLPYVGDNLVILSGDIHRAEISAFDYKGKRFTELSSSGLAVKTYPAANNDYRQGEPYEELNYGLLQIVDDGKLKVKASIHGIDGSEKLSINFKE